MAPWPKLLLVTGIGLIVAAVVWHYGSRILPLGRLPGDLTFEKGNLRVYFPLATCVVVSVVLSLLLYLIGRFWR
jgi:hypothetical protein